MRLIDADAMRQDWLENGQNEYVYDTNAVLDSIDAQPTIDAELVRHGRWFKQTELDEDGNAWYLCSECGYGDKHAESVDVPFCWHCGAKMDKEI